MASRPVDPSKFNITWARKPHMLHGLSSTVVIDGKNFVNINFSGMLVKRAGLLLPRGISIHDPAFMVMKFDITADKYILYVRYLSPDRSEFFKLLEFPERPAWLRYAKPLPTKITAKE